MRNVQARRGARLRAGGVLQRALILLGCLLIVGALTSEAVGAQKALLLVVDTGSPAQLCGNYEPWKQALEAQGYVVIEEFVDALSVQPQDIRALIRQVYERGDIELEGAVLIGAIPAAYAIIHTGDYSDPEAQIVYLSLDAVDMYYEDLDGGWEDVTPEQLDALIANPPPSVAELHPYDSVAAFRSKRIVSLDFDHQWDPWSIPDKSQYQIEIWVSRIMTHNVDVPGASTMDLMNRYFANNVAVRSETLLVESVANILCSGEGYNDQGMDYSAIFDRTEMQEEVTESDYLQLLARPQGSAMTYLTAHSGPAVHAMYESSLEVDELLGCPKTSAFYLLNACSSCRHDWSELQSSSATAFTWTEAPPMAKNGSANYLGGVYIFDRPGDLDNRGLAAVGFTGVGGFNNLYKFTEAYQPGKSYGAMFVEWFNFNLGINFASHNYVILGDPSFTPDDGLHPCATQDAVLIDDGWHMVSIPGQLCDPCLWTDGTICGDLICALEDDLDPCFAYRYDPGLGAYCRIPPSDQICYQPGMSTWICTTEANTEIDAEVMAIGGSVELPVGNGWSQVGNPYVFAIGQDALTIRRGGEEKTLLEAQAAGWISATLYAYDTSTGNYAEILLDTGCLPAWTGCWLRTFVEGCTLVISPVGCVAGGPMSRPLSVAEIRARGLELPPLPPELDARTVSIDEVLGTLAIANVPNPIRSEHTTTFRVSGPMSDLVDAIRVDIYGQNGALVFSERIDDLELVWHTVNDAGELLANGVYLYQVWVRIGQIWYPMEVRKLAVVR